MGARRRQSTEPDMADRDLGPPADPEAVARTIVLTRLTDRARSRQELQDALAAKGVPPETAAAVLDRFQTVGLVDDAAFADAWVESRQSTRGLSRRALRYELRQKGVADDLIAESLERLDPDTELEAARRLVGRKLGATRRLPADVRFRRLTGLLARKGYPPGMSLRVVREALSREAAADTGTDESEIADLLDPI